MDFSPDKTLGLRLGGALGAALLAFMALAVFVLFTQPLGALALVPVTVLIAAGALLVVVGNRLAGLWSARYLLGPEAFTVQWGRRRVEIPLAQIEDIHWGQEYEGDLRPTGLFWPGLVVSRLAHPALGAVEYLATTDAKAGLVLLGYPDGWLAVSPPQPQALIDALQARQATAPVAPAPGEAAPAAAVSAPIPQATPAPAQTQMEVDLAAFAQDRWAIGLLAAGGAALAALAVYLAVVMPTLPPAIALRFDVDGQPALVGPATALWALPGVGAGFWLINAALAAWRHRRPEDRALAYVLLLAACLTAGLAWAAALLLLTAGR